MKQKIINVIFWIIAAFYVFMMLDLFFRFSYIFDTGRVMTRSYNLIPFKTIMDYASKSGGILNAFLNVNVYGNIAALIPYSIYVSVIKKRKQFAGCLLVVFLTTLAIEIIQFAFGLGACDIDDVILNTIGGIIGILLYKLLLKIFKEKDRTKTVITVASFALGVPIIFLYFTTVFNHLRL